MVLLGLLRVLFEVLHMLENQLLIAIEILRLVCMCVDDMNANRRVSLLWLRRRLQR